MDFETLMEKAAAEPAYRPEFYQRILQENLMVIPMNMEPRSGERVLETGDTVSLYVFPNGSIPVFTSTERIYEKGIVNHQVQFLQITGEGLFNLAKGATFILNPYSDYGKELVPAEIEGILKGML